jgi:hypothetical protein
VDLIRNVSVFRRFLKENKILPVDICVVILFVIDVLCEDVNQSEITMANIKLAVRRPNIKPFKHGGIDEHHCGDVHKDFNLKNGNIIFCFKLI